MGGKKAMTIQHFVNPSLLPTHRIRYFEDTNCYYIDGQVLFFSGHGGHWAADDREQHFVAVYCPKSGNLKALFNMMIVQSITEAFDE